MTVPRKSQAWSGAQKQYAGVREVSLTIAGIYCQDSWVRPNTVPAAHDVGPHRTDVGEVGVPYLHSAVGGQRDQAPQPLVILDVPHLVVLLPRARLHSQCATSAWTWEAISLSLNRIYDSQFLPYQLL